VKPSGHDQLVRGDAAITEEHHYARGAAAVPVKLTLDAVIVVPLVDALPAPT